MHKHEAICYISQQLFWLQYPVEIKFATIFRDPVLLVSTLCIPFLIRCEASTLHTNASFMSDRNPATFNECKIYPESRAGIEMITTVNPKYSNIEKFSPW